MEDIGDDFGDLYADVEIQASSAINAAPSSVRFYKNDTEKVEGFASALNSKGIDSGDVSSSRKSENEELDVVPDVVDYGSDSEDDFNIVLNNEGGQRFPVRSGIGVIGGSNGDGEDGDGMEQGFAAGERGNGVKGGYHLQFSQHKVVSLSVLCHQ